MPLTQDCVLDPQEDPLEVAEVTPRRLEHVHDVVHAQVLDPVISIVIARSEQGALVLTWHCMG